MIQEIAHLVDRYRDWLKDKTSLREVGEFVEITTPFLDRHNDYIQLYARRENGAYVLSDDGATIDDLEMSGCTLDSPKRQELLRVTLAGFGVTHDRGALQVKAAPENFSLRKHNLIQAMLAVNDLFYLAPAVVGSLFLEDVRQWLDSLDVRYMQNVGFRGKSGYDHLFHFAIPKSKQAPERLLHTINNPTKDAAETMAFRWIDTRDVRDAGAQAYVILNDHEKRIPAGVGEALASYDIHPLIWSARDSAMQPLLN